MRRKKTRQDSSQKRTANHHRGISLWSWTVIGAVALGVFAVGAWIIAGTLNEKYQQMDRLGPIPLEPAMPEVWLRVDYPRMLSRIDQGAQTAKRLIVQPGLNPGVQESQIVLDVRSETAGIRLLDGNGDPISGRIAITVTRGTNSPTVFFIEHTQIGTDSSFSIALDLLPPTAGITEPQPISGGILVIQEEPTWHQILRELARPASNVTTWLALLGGMASTLLGLVNNRHAKMDDLYQEAYKAVDRGDFEEYRAQYGKYQLLRWPRQTSFHLILHPEMEKLDRVAQERCEAVQNRQEQEQEQKRQKEKAFAAEKAAKEKSTNESYAQAMAALERENMPDFRKQIDCLQDLASDHPVIALLKTIHDLEQKHRQIGQDDWFFEDSTSGKDELEKALASDSETIRRWAARLLAHFNGQDVKEKLQALWEQNTSPVVCAEAAWGYSQKERQKDQILHLASAQEVETWLEKFSFGYNPFALITVEQENLPRQVQHFTGHPAYDRLVNCVGHTALLAASGCGKTTFRLQFKRELEEQPHRPLVVEYVDFSPWIPWDWDVTPSARVHTDRIMRQTAQVLKHDPEKIAPSNCPYVERFKRLVSYARANQYPGGVRVLVDNVDAGHDARQDPAIAERIIRNLMDTSDILTVEGLTFHFFLPSSLHDYIQNYDTLSQGLIEKICIVWTVDQLSELLRQRIEAASDKKTNSLNRLYENLERPMNWDKIVTELANNSPRRLIRLVNLLFRHRARQYDKDKKAQIQPIDWAYLFERLASGEI